MKRAVLFREYKEFQTLGNFYGYDENFNEVFRCKTIELPWKFNKKNISCIPGYGNEYHVKKYKSPSKGWCYLFTNVVNRTYIEIHVANFKRDLLGCIGPGKTFTDIDGDGYRDVTSSGATLNKMFEAMGEEFNLTIV